MVSKVLDRHCFRGVGGFGGLGEHSEAAFVCDTQNWRLWTLLKQRATSYCALN